MQKKTIIQFIKKYKAEKNLVGFVGDGTNDSEALVEADISLSLGDFTMSISAPFVSKVKNISQITTLISEGRGSLYSGLLNFRFLLFIIGQTHSLYHIRMDFQ